MDLDLSVFVHLAGLLLLARWLGYWWFTPTEALFQLRQQLTVGRQQQASAIQLQAQNIATKTQQRLTLARRAAAATAHAELQAAKRTAANQLAAARQKATQQLQQVLSESQMEIAQLAASRQQAVANLRQLIVEKLTLKPLQQEKSH